MEQAASVLGVRLLAYSAHVQEVQVDKQQKARSKWTTCDAVTVTTARKDGPDCHTITMEISS